MAKLTKQQWDELEAKYSLYSPIKLRCDGHIIDLFMSIYKNRVMHQLYINGWFKGEWFNREQNHPESKYLYEKTITIRTHSDKELRAVKRTCGAAFAKKFEPKKVNIYQSYYPSFTAFKRRMNAVCENIEIYVENEGQEG
jgi:hypothetical protein